MKKLYFIRHGESEGNARRIFSGQVDHPLTENGRAQAKKASKKAKNIPIDCIVSSPLSRALETAQIIAAEIGYPKDMIIISNLLTERGYGDLHGKPYERVDNISFNDVPNIETDSQLISRAGRAHKFISALDAENILVCAHGTLGRALRSQILNQPPGDIEVTLENEIPNAEIICWI